MTVWNNFPVEKHGVVYMLIPKAGNSSIKAAIKRDLGLSDAPDDIQRGWNYIGPGEIVRDYTDWKAAAFVRNPYARLVSCWWQKLHRHGASKLTRYGFRNGMPFDAFVETCVKWRDKDVDQHVRSQVFGLMHAGRLVPDFIGHCETLDRDWQRFQAWAGLDLPDLERRNASDHTDYRDYYTPRLRALVEQRYGDDIAAFGYAF